MSAPAASSAAPAPGARFVLLGVMSNPSKDGLRERISPGLSSVTRTGERRWEGGTAAAAVRREGYIS